MNNSYIPFNTLYLDGIALTSNITFSFSFDTDNLEYTAQWNFKDINIICHQFVLRWNCVTSITPTFQVTPMFLFTDPYCTVHHKMYTMEKNRLEHITWYWMYIQSVFYTWKNTFIYNQFQCLQFLLMVIISKHVQSRLHIGTMLFVSVMLCLWTNTFYISFPPVHPEKYYKLGCLEMQRNFVWIRECIIHVWLVPGDAFHVC